MTDDDDDEFAESCSAHDADSIPQNAGISSRPIAREYNPCDGIL